jgi:hypothetical protein
MMQFHSKPPHHLIGRQHGTDVAAAAAAAADALRVAGFMPYTKIGPERLRAGHKGDLSYLMGKKVKARIVQVRVTVTTQSVTS